MQKCTFCAPRVDQGLEPACVVTCPTDARVFGDLDDEESTVSVLIRERDGRPAQEEAGTKPSVYYLEPGGSLTTNVPPAATDRA